MIIKRHKILILTGVLLWVSGFFMAAMTIYPFALIGVYVGPPILTMGIVGWIINYKHTKSQFPNPIRAFNRILKKHKGLPKYHFAMFEFLFSYLLHFWTFCIVFWIGIAFLGTTAFKNSNAFATTKNYVESDSRLIERIGQIRYYGFLIGGTISSSGDADISFSIIGDKETINAKAILERGKVTEIKYKQH
ncbi:MAG: cytochrome c oxidase assembly factor 1 family protein [Flavobacteriales bacterium]|jgi:hypothetical protein|nr:cytochrome c oxidase assembly factor 1 family protein [Flavobacteriales bacterium]